MSQNPWARPEHPDEQPGGMGDGQHPGTRNASPTQSSQGQSSQGQPSPDRSSPQQPAPDTWGQPSFLAGSWPQHPQQGGGQPQGWVPQPPPQAYAQQPYPQQSYPQQPYPQQQAWQSAPPPSTRQAQPYAAPPSAARGGRVAAALGDTPVTWAIIAICVLVWLGELAVPGFFDRVALTPADARTQPWRFVTSAFAHSTTITHIVFNMLALWSLRMLEPFLGRARYLATYLLCALAGGAAVVLLSSPTQQSWYTEVIGASGAIFGLFGVLVFALRAVQASTNQLWAVIGVNLFISFTVPDIAWQAHLGGFAMGLLSGWLLVRERRNRLQGRPDRGWLWIGLLFLAVIALVVVKYALSPVLG